MFLPYSLNGELFSSYNATVYLGFLHNLLTVNLTIHLSLQHSHLFMVNKKSVYSDQAPYLQRYLSIFLTEDYLLLETASLKARSQGEQTLKPTIGFGDSPKTGISENRCFLITMSRKSGLSPKKTNLPFCILGFSKSFLLYGSGLCIPSSTYTLTVEDLHLPEAQAGGFPVVLPGFLKHLSCHWIPALPPTAVLAGSSTTVSYVWGHLPQGSLQLNCNRTLARVRC